MHKILLYSSFYFPSVGGTEMATYLLAEQLYSNGYEVTIVTQTPDENQTLDKPLHQKISIVRKPSFGKLFSLCKSHDLLIVNGGFSVRAWLGAWPSGIPTILIHAMITDGLRKTWKPQDIIGDALRNSMKKRVAKHVGVSSHVLKSAGVDGVVIPNMIAPEILAKSKKATKSAEKKFDGIFVGRLIKTKGLSTIIEAVSIARKQDKFLRLAVVGDGEFKQEAEKLAAQLEVSEQITFFGSLSADELADIYRQSKVLIHTPDAPEGFGMGLIEAMCFGLPVLVNDMPALPETAGDSGLIIPQKDPNALYQNWIRIIEDQKLYKKYSELSLNRSAEFYPELVFKKWEKLFRELS